ncbi:MAG: hypothetical protein R2821_10760 [Flavobacteriaceae bacterium]|jgi:hypothetical protein
MSGQEDKQLDDFLKKVIKEVPLKTPAENFTEQLLQKIAVEKQQSSISYTPIISTKGWIFIFSTILLIISYLYINNTSATSEQNQILAIFNNILSAFDFTFSINFSETFSYAIVLLIPLLLIQITLLKKHFNKLYNV